jgi:hypothetical protein
MVSLPPHSTSDLHNSKGAALSDIDWDRALQFNTPALPVASKRMLMQVTLPAADALQLRELRDDLPKQQDPTLSEADVDKYNKVLEGVLIEKNLWRKACAAMTDDHKNICGLPNDSAENAINQYAKQYVYEARSVQSSLPVSQGNAESTMPLRDVIDSANLLFDNFDKNFPAIDQAIAAYKQSSTQEAADRVVDYVLGLAAIHRSAEAFREISEQLIDSNASLNARVKVGEILEKVEQESSNRELVGKVWNRIKLKK